MAVTLDDDVKVYKPSGGERGRWSRLCEALPAEWVRLELQDKEGSVLWGCDAADGAGAAAPAKVGSVVSETAQLMKIMLAGQDTALSRNREFLGAMQQGYETLARVLTDRLSSLENMMGTLLQSVYDSTLANAELQAALATSEGKGQPTSMDKLMELAAIKAGIIPARVRQVPRPNGQHVPASTPPTRPPGE